MTHNILVSDPISEKGLQSLIHHPDFNVDFKSGLTEKELVDIIPLNFVNLFLKLDLKLKYYASC
jgi:D-3-phosphoglycerate dehydrogenase